jgi:hypothetical protein
MKTGSCLCGAVAYVITGPMKDALACHCTQCRKQTGSYWISSSVVDADLNLTKQDGLKWFASSDSAKRGFCKECGSNLFWKQNGSDTTSICVGSIDGKTGLNLEGHIFCDDAGDYYEIADGGFKKPQW